MISTAPPVEGREFYWSGKWCGMGDQIHHKGKTWWPLFIGSDCGVQLCRFVEKGWWRKRLEREETLVLAPVRHLATGYGAQVGRMNGR